MKTFLKIAAGFIIFLIVLVIGLNLYLTDERLRDMIVPQVREMTGSEIQVDHLSVTLFRTFPYLGVDLTNFEMPDPMGNPVASAEEVLVSVKFFPLFRNEVSISRLSVSSPNINYIVFADSTTNLDFLFELDEDETDEQEPYDIAIPRFIIRSASLHYQDQTSDTQIDMANLDADLSINYAEIIESTIDATVGSFSVSIDGAQYIDNLALSMSQKSSLDLENEIFNFEEGTFSIRGLALNLTGSVSSWSNENPDLSLQFSSSSENFGELLRLAPPRYDEALAGLQTRGGLVFEGSIEGRFTEEDLPRFDLIIDVTDGFLQNPDLPEAVEDIRLSVIVNNDLATISEFRARAGVNSVTGTGTVERPLDDDALFSLDFDGDIDLATVSSFYPIGDLGIEQLAGILKADARANGQMDQLEEAAFSGNFILSDGTLKFEDVPNSIEQINARVEANQDRVIIPESGFQAVSNQFRMSGSIERPLDEERRTVDLTTNLNFDLATIKDFYPIDEDTLSMSGNLIAEIVLRGRPDPDQIESLLQQSTFQLDDGFLSHSMVAQPLEDITFRAEASGRELSISQAQFKTGENSLSMRGTVTDYLSDDPQFNLTFDGDAVLSDITSYYSLEPWINELTGNAVLNLNARGPAGDPLQIALDGLLTVTGVNAAGDSLALPVSNLESRMRITPQSMTLEEFSMDYGSSDIQLQGTLQNYLGFLQEHNSEETIPSISGTYHSRLLNIDEMIDWDEEADDDPISINLPDMTTSVDASIDRLIIFGIPITEISGRGRTNSQQIVLDEATGNMFDGTLSGAMEWNVIDSLNTNMRFTGNLDSLSAQAFFRDTGFLGGSDLHRYLSGSFSADIDYFSELDPSLSPDLSTARVEGHFGMSRARMQNHPIQNRLAEWLRTDELRNLALDEWTAVFTVDDGVMTFEDLQLTSENIGLQLSGTQNLLTESINFRATIILPETFKNTIASVISSRAADALQREDGMMAIPFRITGTSSSPSVGPDTDVIDNIIQELIQDTGRDVLRRLFDRN